MTTQKVAPPNLPDAPAQQSKDWMNQYSNVLRLFFNKLVNRVNNPTGKNS